MRSAIIEVVIHWAEGQGSLKCPKTFKTLGEANRFLRQLSWSAPQGGGYDKVKFTLTWADQNQFTGRYDLVHPTASNQVHCFGLHARRFFEFASGEHCPGHMTAEQYRRVLAQSYDLETQQTCRAALQKLAFAEEDQP